MTKCKKLILESKNTNNSGEADKPIEEVCQENTGQTHFKEKLAFSRHRSIEHVVRRREERKGSHSFQDYFSTGARDIEQNNQKAVSTAGKHQADPLILFIIYHEFYARTWIG